MDEITRLGREHLALHGAAALSLRAVARDLGVVSSAVYRYVSSRDELLTLLLVDVFNELGDAVDAALAEVPADAHADRFRALAAALRGWAQRDPAGFALAYGSPVPGYHAPAERTTGPGTRVIVALIGIFDRAHQAGCVPELAPIVLSTTARAEGLRRDCEAVRDRFALDLPDTLIARVVFVMTALFGAISWDVFDQYGPGIFTDRDAIFDYQLELMLQTVGMS